MKKNLLRTVILSCAFCLISNYSKAQWVTIPDPDFANDLRAFYFQCMNGNLMDTTCYEIVNAVSLNLSNGQIHDFTGISYFDNLRELIIPGNNMVTFPPLPNTLRVLDCSIAFNLTSLPTLPNSLDSLICYRTSLTSLPTLPGNLTYLECSTTGITSLPTLPNSLLELRCTDHQLNSLPSLPNGLQILDCSSPNQINYIHALPDLPSTLVELNCNGNYLDTMPALPYGLKKLNCGSSHITGFSYLPNSLVEFKCQGANLESLPELPDSLLVLDISYNSLLRCLPRLKRIVNFYCENTGAICLPNVDRIDHLYPPPPVGGYPICDEDNPFGCPFFTNVFGRTYADLTNDCIKDSNEYSVQSIKVILFRNDTLIRQFYTNSYGDYSFVADYGTYTITVDTTGVPFDIFCPTNRFDTAVVASLDSFSYNLDFALHCKQGFDLIAQNIDGRFRPGNISAVAISAGDANNFYGARCAAATSGSVQLIIKGAAHYAASMGLTPTTVVNDTITWNIPDFGAVDFFHAFNINVATDTTAVLGSQICFTLIVNPIA